MSSQGSGPFNLFNLAALALTGAMFGATAAHAQATVAETAQTLDRVDIIYANDADNIEIDTTITGRPWVSNDYGLQATTSFTQCQNTATRGLYCLDGNVVKRFPNPTNNATVEIINLFDCGNPVFNFDRDNVCTALTADIAGNIWVAGKKRSKFSLFKVVESATKPAEPDTTASKWTKFTTNGGTLTFWAREYAAGRPLLVDLSIVDGDVAASFPYGGGIGGVIAVEERKEVTFFTDKPQAAPVTIGRGGVWALSRGELLQSSTLLQKYLPNTNPALETTRNWVIITTSAGRLLSRELPWIDSTLLPVIDHSTQANIVATDAVAAACVGNPSALYDIRSSVKTRAIYVTDRRGCRALALKTNIDSSTFDTSTTLFFSPAVVIASTSPEALASPTQALLQAPPEAVSIAPGTAIAMRDECPATNPNKVCPLVGDGADTDDTTIPAASMTQVKLDPGSPDGLVVFQIQNIPDCRYIKNTLQPPTCLGAIRTPDGSAVQYDTNGFPLNPEKLFLNIKPLLPLEVTRVKSIPDMLLSPRYKALDDKNTFDALFGITADGVRFRDTFSANFDLADLIPGRKLGCGRATSTYIQDPLNNWFDQGPRWDAVVTISENFTTVGGLPNGTRQYTDMLVNTFGCNDLDPPLAGTRWSLYAYGLKLAKERVPNRANPAGPLDYRYSDSIFAKLTAQLFADLGATIQTYLCTDRDGANGVPPLGAGCSGLYDSWRVTNDKLVKCVESSTEPLNSTEIRACNAFDVQYASFAPQITGLTRTGPDPGNRVGEVKARLEIFRSVYEEQFLPSIPPDTGFFDPL